MYIVKDDNFEPLKNFGFTKDNRAIFPTRLIKIIDAEQDICLKVCDEKEKSYNVWTRKDWKDVGILYLWNGNHGTCSSEIINPYIQDLIKLGLVEERERA